MRRSRRRGDAAPVGTSSLPAPRRPPVTCTRYRRTSLLEQSWFVSTASRGLLVWQHMQVPHICMGLVTAVPFLTRAWRLGGHPCEGARAKVVRLKAG